jgi:hypothetical protein
VEGWWKKSLSWWAVGGLAALLSWFTTLLCVAAAVRALEQASFRLTLDTGSLGVCAFVFWANRRVVVGLVETELGLNGRRMDAVLVEALTHLTGKVHVACWALILEVKVDLDMERGDELSIRELPDVQVVTRDDAVQISNVFLDLVDGKVLRHGLEKDTRRSFAERDGREKNDNSDDERNKGVGIEPPRVVGKPDKQRSCDDTDIAKSITQDMEEDTAHVQVTVGVTMTAATLLVLGFGMVVALVVVLLRGVRVWMAVALAQQGCLFGRLINAALACFGVGVVRLARRLNDAVPEGRRMYVDLVEGRVSLGAWSNAAVAALARGRLTAYSLALRRAALVFVLVCMVVCMVVCVIVCLDAMRMTFLGMGVLVTRTVRMATRSVAVSDVVKQHETDNVRGKTEGSDYKDELGLRYLLRLDKSLNGFEEDGQTEGD